MPLGGGADMRRRTEVADPRGGERAVHQVGADDVGELTGERIVRVEAPLATPALEDCRRARPDLAAGASCAPSCELPRRNQTGRTEAIERLGRAERPERVPPVRESGCKSS